MRLLTSETNISSEYNLSRGFSTCFFLSFFNHGILFSLSIYEAKFCRTLAYRYLVLKMCVKLQMYSNQQEIVQLSL
jgi:hypothetical protein